MNVRTWISQGGRYAMAMAYGRDVGTGVSAVTPKGDAEIDVGSDGELAAKEAAGRLAVAACEAEARYLTAVLGGVEVVDVRRGALGGGM